jgi:hypothetical protein
MALRWRLYPDAPVTVDHLNSTVEEASTEFGAGEVSRLRFIAV